MKKLIVLGSTGSIGSQTLDVVRQHPDRFSVVALAAKKSWQHLVKQAREFKVEAIALLDDEAAFRAQEELQDSKIVVLSGRKGVESVATWGEADLVVSSMVGMAGLVPTLKAVQVGRDVALANKESLVVGGPVLMEAVAQNEVQLIPIDSEHSAILQCVTGEDPKSINRLILTASGGPFRTWDKKKLSQARANEALQHPTWEMGAKITIDSATLMNKGFEVLEAYQLFNISLDNVEVWVHPQSIIHSFVEFVDGSTLAQLGPPDMRTPISYALSYPERLPPRWEKLTLELMQGLTFEEPRWKDFPCLEMAYSAGRTGGTMPCVLNAANEVVVELFLKEKILFTDIPRILEKVMNEHTTITGPSLDDILGADDWARGRAREIGRACTKAP
ncbi:MAG: 1-deoxy-D-xylulose-5-phosphate reductoisomerase [Vulcanimicrobiota bacterium]